MMRCALLLVWLSSMLFAQQALDKNACVADSGNHENLNALLWMRTSIEYRHNTIQAYRLAERMLLDALSKPDWTAAIEQSAGYERLPPAVILDIDETVLDNSPSEAAYMQRGAGAFTPEGWSEWVNRAAATAIPGARRFLQLAESRGVEVFYVTNREISEKAKTLENLRAARLPFADETHVLTTDNTLGWSSEKSSRRRYLAARYRILLLVGDDAGDFLPGVRTTLAEREAAIAPYESFLGTRWIILPNPTYGSWESALSGGRPAPREQALHDKCRMLPQDYSRSNAREQTDEPAVAVSAPQGSGAAD